MSVKKLVILSLCLVILSLSKGQNKFFWRQYSGPVQTIILNPDSANTIATGLNLVGIYGYELSVSNEFGLDKDSCLVTVINGVLALDNDTAYHIQRPDIKKLEIKMIARTNDIYIQIKSPRLQTIECILCDITGRRLARIEMKVTKGINYMSVPKPQIRGIYILRFSTYYENLTEKIFL